MNDERRTIMRNFDGVRFRCAQINAKTREQRNVFPASDRIVVSIECGWREKEIANKMEKRRNNGRDSDKGGNVIRSKSYTNGRDTANTGFYNTPNANDDCVRIKFHNAIFIAGKQASSRSLLDVF